VIRVLYGYPTEKTSAAADRGAVVLGGCIVGPETKVCSICHVHPDLVDVGLVQMVPRAPGITGRQRLAGAVWGHLIGDALGVPYEFLPAAEITAVELRGGGAHGQPAGTWSDDGALMLASADSFIEQDVFDPDDQGRRFLQWADAGAYTPDGDGKFDIGGATSRALANLRHGVPAIEAGRTGPNDAGNGSLMRILPIALFSDMQPDEVLVQRAHLASRVTHADARCQVACALYVLLARRLLGGASAPEPILAESAATLQAMYRQRPAWVDDTHAPVLEQLLARRASVTYGSGFVLDTFWGAWEAFAAASGYAEAVETAIRYGNDTDTTAAVAGGLAGIHWGVEGIPREWLEGLRGQDIVVRVLEGTLFGRPIEALDA
jgi:ADP-ribosylglycohydrolase